LNLLPVAILSKSFKVIQGGSVLQVVRDLVVAGESGKLSMMHVEGLSPAGHFNVAVPDQNGARLAVRIDADQILAFAQ
jgi:hypothetical protein